VCLIDVDESFPFTPLSLSKFHERRSFDISDLVPHKNDKIENCHDITFQIALFKRSSKKTIFRLKVSLGMMYSFKRTPKLKVSH